MILPGLQSNVFLLVFFYKQNNIRWYENATFYANATVELN